MATPRSRREPGPAAPSPPPAAREPGPSTQSVHGGEPRQQLASALTSPIVQTATYAFRDSREIADHFEGRVERDEYGRYGNPTQRVAEKKLAALEGAQEGLLFASGMAAITTTLFAMLSKGAHVVVTDDAYRRTRQFLNQVLRRYGVEVTTVPAGDYERIEEAIRRTTRLVFSESPTNPYNRVVDLERLAELGRRHRVKTVIDSTFATPINQRPIEFGIDLVIHSATKYLGGHNDLMAGAVLGSRNLVGAIRDLHARDRRGPRPVRGVPPHPGHQDPGAPRDAPERERPADRRVPEAHPKVERVHYPGLKSHPEHDSRGGRCGGSAGSSRSRCAGTSPPPRAWSTPVGSRGSPRLWAGWRA